MILRALCSRVAAITFVCSGLAASAYTQPVPFFETRFAEAVAESQRLTEKKSRRLESVWKSFKDGTVIKSGTSIAEFVATGRERTYHRVVEGNSVKESESIVIGGVEYSRENGGTWTKAKMGGMGMGSGTGGKSVAQVRMELTTLDGKEVRLFEEFRVQGGDFFNLRFYRNRIWIGPDGLLLKHELSSGTVEPRMDEHTEVITYSYDSVIKIEPPIK